MFLTFVIYMYVLNLEGEYPQLAKLYDICKSGINMHNKLFMKLAAQEG